MFLGMDASRRSLPTICCVAWVTVKGRGEETYLDYYEADSNCSSYNVKGVQEALASFSVLRRNGLVTSDLCSKHHLISAWGIAGAPVVVLASI